MGKSIKSRIMLFSGALLLTVLLCQVVFGLFFSKNYYTHLKMTEVETLFYDLKERYTDDLNAVSDLILQAETARNITVRIFSETEMIYGSNQPGLVGILPSGMNLFGRNFMGQDDYVFEPKAVISHFPNTPRMPELPGLFNAENIVLSGIIEYNGEYRYIRLQTPIEAIEASVAALTRANAYITVFVLVIGIAGSLIFAGRFSKPVKRIQEVARNVSLLNFEVRADETAGALELRDLSGSINVMADKLNGLITDLRASNEKLQADVDYQMRLDKMRREFVANVSHELKTPLHLLMMYGENLKNNIDGIDKDYYCDTIIEETNRLNDMVKSLLNLSAIENGLEKMDTENFDLSDFAEFVISKMAVLFEKLSTNVRIEKGIIVNGDSRYVEQAIKNYIVNAVSHTSAGGSISVSLARQNEKVLFSVFNKGAHIAAEDLLQIWESFYKTDKARARTEENHSGLGLYIVKTIIEAHGGEYGANNTANGVEFWFSLAVVEK